MWLLPNVVVQLVNCVTPDVWATQRSFWLTQVTQAVRSRTQPFGTAQFILVSGGG
jgi:hypothetical protein